MNIRFIDTSIVMNLLRIPHMCQEYESVKKEFNEAIEQNETLILPLATIIESGNHISSPFPYFVQILSKSAMFFGYSILEYKFSCSCNILLYSSHPGSRTLLCSYKSWSSLLIFTSKLSFV